MQRDRPLKAQVHIFKHQHYLLRIIFSSCEKSETNTYIVIQVLLIHNLTEGCVLEGSVEITSPEKGKL